MVHTPHLDRLAAAGTRFAHAYASSPLCVPSRMSFLTGRRPSSTGVWTNTCVLPSEVPTFAHALGAAGYETVLCGRMHFMGPDQLHGFDRRLVGDVIGTYFGGLVPDFGEVPLAAADEVAASVELSGPGHTSYHAYDAAVVDAAVDFLRHRGPDEPPFCMVVGFVLPHCPYIAPPDVYAKYEGRVALPVLPDDYHRNLHPAIAEWRALRKVDALSPDDRLRARTAYYALVDVVDGNVGTILDALAGSPAADGTVVAYTSDHGDMAGEHGMWWKSNLYDGAAGVPLVWAGAGVPSGHVVDEPVELVDVGPTLTRLATAPPLANVDGRVLAPVVDGTPLPPADVFSETVPARGGQARMLRRGRWKVVVHDGHEAPQLFDMDADPDEMHDRSDDPACATVRDELVARVREGWAPRHIATVVQRRAADRELLVRWHRAVGHADPSYWVPPGDSNRFPMWVDPN